MQQPYDTSFVAPTSQQFMELLAMHPPTGPSKMATWGPLIILAFIGLTTIATNVYPMHLLSWLTLGGVFAFWVYRLKRVRKLDRMVGQVQELGMRRMYAQSLRLSWRLIPDLSAVPPLHGRTVAFMAMCLDQLLAYDAAIVGYSYLIDRLPGEHPSRTHLQTQRAIAQLANDQLADADDAIRRLRGHVMELTTAKPNQISALYHFAQLYQSTRTYHLASVLEEESSWLDRLRPLGIEAGYGHAMVALAHLEMSRRDGAEEPKRLRDLAETWWARATLLLPAGAMVQRYPELKPLVEDEGTGEAARPNTPPIDVVALDEANE